MHYACELSEIRDIKNDFMRESCPVSLNVKFSNSDIALDVQFKVFCLKRFK